MLGTFFFIGIIVPFWASIVTFGFPVRPKALTFFVVLGMVYTCVVFGVLLDAGANQHFTTATFDLVLVGGVLAVVWWLIAAVRGAYVSGVERGRKNK